MITVGASRVASDLLCLHAIATTPAGLMELVRSSISTISGLPCEKVRSAPAIVFSGPAQRSPTLWPARSPSRLATFYIESSDSFVASAAASIATGWSEPVPGRELHPLKSSAFHGALFRQLPREARIPAVGGIPRKSPEIAFLPIIRWKRYSQIFCGFSSPIPTTQRGRLRDGTMTRTT
jgi:hypothetical protein